MRPAHAIKQTSPSRELAREVFGPKNHAAWIIGAVTGAVFAVVGLWFSYHLFTLSAGSDQVDKGFNGHAAMIGGLSTQVSAGFDQQRAQIADLGRTLTNRFDGFEQVNAARKPQPGTLPVPGTEAKPGPRQPASVAGPSAVPVPMHRQLWRIDAPSPAGKPVSVAFGVAATDPRIEALFLSQIGVELGNFGLTVTAADGKPADQFVSFDATIGSAAPRSGCNIMKNLTLHGSFTGGMRSSGDLLHTVVEQCLDGQPTADDVKDQLVRIAARHAASSLASRSLARL